MEGPPGRREAKKDAVRAALGAAAKRLFSDRGYEATTVRDIADAAGVTERTFYRYFDGKEGLIAEETIAWIEILHDAIRDRPVSEPPLEAAGKAMLDVAKQARTGIGPAPVWLFTDRPRPFALIRRSSPRMLLRIEDSIAAALRAREPRAAAKSEFRLELLARVAVAALRSAAIHHRRLERDGRTSPGIERLLRNAFVELGVAATPPGGTLA